MQVGRGSFRLMDVQGPVTLLEFDGLEVDAEAQGSLVQASLDLQGLKAFDTSGGDAEVLLSRWQGAPLPNTSVAC